MTKSAVPEKVRAFVASQKFAVLSTSAMGQPYASLVAFAENCDLTGLFFATRRATHKYENLADDPCVALLVDNRTNTDADLQGEQTLTILGVCTELADAERAAAAEEYCVKHPGLTAFVSGADCALMRLDVGTYCLVDQFEHVEEWCPHA